MSDALFSLSASEVIQQLRGGALTHKALYDRLEAEIALRNPPLNAIVTTCFDRARAQIATTPDLLDRPLAGLPLLVKDLTDVEGVRTTYGSQIFADHVPTKSDLLVEKLEAAGAVVVGKTNTPEFGAGANTFNEVFGATVNPHNTALTCGGSSGGAAVALAAQMGWFATGSDYGGSLRIPAAFCGVFGLRPTLGSIPMGGQAPRPIDPLNDRTTDGPMAARLADLELMLLAMAGPDVRDVRCHRALAPKGQPQKRIAYMEDFGEILPVVEENRATVRATAEKYSAAGFAVDRVQLDLSGVRDAFQTFRALDFVTGMGPLLNSHRDKLKPEVIWNIEKGLALTAADLSAAMASRGALIHNLIELFQSYDALMVPCTAVRPFPVEQRYIKKIGDVTLDTYVDWLAPTFLFSLWPGPSMSVPVGIGADSLPDSVQLIGPIGQDRTLLSVAGAVDEAAVVAL